MLIRKDNLQGPEIARLLRAHLENAAKHSPPESIHALNLDALRAPEITFWTAWEGRDLMGCGALKELDTNHGEIKSMHTAERHRRRGVAAGMLRAHHSGGSETVLPTPQPGNWVNGCLCSRPGTLC
jgi:putative acetyltransferase